MKKLLTNFSNKMRAPSSEADSGGPPTAGYSVNRRKMEKLHKAAWLGDITKLRWLAMCNVDVNRVDKHNRTALHLACATGNAGVVEFLLGKQAKINLCDNQKRTALMKNDADLDLMDADGNTALHLAAKIPALSCAILLVKKDADLNVKNLKGLSPLTMAVQGGHIAVTEFLLREGADVDILDKNQRSPLIMAAGSGQMHTVQMLLTFKADFTLKDNKGLSAEHYAEMNGHQSCALLITEHANNKRNLAASLAPPVECEQTVRVEQGNATGAIEIRGGPSTSKDGDDMYSPISECVNTRAGHDRTEEIQPKEIDMNRWGLLLSKCEEKSPGKLELMEELGFGEFDCNEDMDKSSNASSGSLSGCIEEFQEYACPSLKEEVVYASPKLPFALPTTVSPDDKKVVASPSSPAHPHSPKVIIQESDETDWGEDSLISFCMETKSDKQQQLQEAIRGGSPDVSIMARDGGSSRHSVEQQQKDAAVPETWNEKPSDEEEEKSILCNVVQSFMLKSGSVNGEKQSGSSLTYEESSDEGDVESLSPVHENRQWESGSEDSVVESPGRSLKDEDIADCQLPARKNIVLRKAVESPQAPKSLTKKEENSVDFATTICTAGHVASVEIKAGPCHNLELKEPEVIPMTMKNLSDLFDTGGRTTNNPTNEQPETSRVELQLAHQLRLNGQTEDCSQLTVVSEVCGLRVIHNNGGISKDLLGFDSTLSDLLDDDGSIRWQSAECLKRTPSSILNTEDIELSKDTDDGVISEDSDVALHIRKLGAVTSDSRSKKNLWDIDERCLLKANGHLGPLRERLRQLEIANHILEQSNIESKFDVANLTAQLKMAINTIVSNESTTKKLEEDRMQAEMLLVHNHNTLNALHQKVNSQLYKQKEMEEECKRSKSIEEQLRAELEGLQADSSTKQRGLAEENEDLKDQVEDLRQELRLTYDNENQNTLDWNNAITSLKYELKLANDRLEAEQQAHANLVAEVQLTHTCLAEAEQARSDMEKALFQEKEEKQRLASEVSCHRETVSKLSQKLSKMKAHANTMESDVRRYEVQMAEKTARLNTMQRESELLQSEKELAARATLCQESAQENLNQAQNKVTLLRQQLEEAQNNAVANENALTTAKKGFDDTLLKLRTDCEERVQQAQVGHKELTCKASELKTLVRTLEQEKTERQSCQKQLQQELDELLKKLSKCEASLEFSTRYRSDLEEEKTRLLQDNDKLRGKLQEREAQCILAEKEMKERASLLDERKKELSVVTRKQKEAQADAAASNDNARQLEEAVQRLELNNIRLEASAKQQSNKFDALQKAAQEDARMRVQLEDLLTILQSQKITLEDQLNKEVQKHSVLSNNVQDTQLMWEEELKGRSKLGLRLAEMEKEKKEVNTQMNMEKKKAEELAEQKRASDARLEQEMKRNSDLQKEIYRLQSLLKLAKKKLHDQQMSGEDREKLSHQVNGLQAELEREVSSRSQLERTRRRLEEEVLSLKRSQGPPLDGGSLPSAANAMGVQCRCHCSKALSPVSEGPSVEDYLAKMRQDLDEAMSRELDNPSVNLDTCSACMSPVTRARQQYMNVLKKNREV
ncbi:uncharacterized protein LOC144053697 isoform X3 [Vanacampus margaritifer]